jgi:hypothetical protein
MIKNEKFKLTLFIIYTILYECLIWGLVASSIYYLEWSEWTVVIGILMSGVQLDPSYFGLDYEIKE